MPLRVSAEESSPSSIRNPGPDLSNFPNASRTLPGGGIYLETTPATFTGPDSMSPKQYNWEFLLRYGLTDRVELRLYSQGLSVQGSPQPATGFAPLTFDTKIYLAEDAGAYFNYSLGIEAYVQSTWGSAAFDSGAQYSFALNLDHDLPWDLALNWNVGVLMFDSPDTGTQLVLPSFQWALQREVAEDVAIFLQGYGNSSAVPRITPSGRKPQDLMTQQMLGAGVQWTVNDQIAVYGSYSWGLGRNTPDYFGNLGFSLAY